MFYGSLRACRKTILREWKVSKRLQHNSLGLCHAVAKEKAGRKSHKYHAQDDLLHFLPSLSVKFKTSWTQFENG